jgi:hypothetical protein
MTDLPAENEHQLDRLPELLLAVYSKGANPTPLDPEQASALVIAHLTDNPTMQGTEAAWYSLRQEVASLQDGDAATIRRALARHAVVLDHLGNHLMRVYTSGKCRKVENLMIVAKTYASVQQAAAKTLVALGSLAVKEITEDGY